MKVEILPMAILSPNLGKKFLQKGLWPGSRDPFYETRNRADSANLCQGRVNELDLFKVKVSQKISPWLDTSICLWIYICSFCPSRDMAKNAFCLSMTLTIDLPKVKYFFLAL